MKKIISMIMLMSMHLSGAPGDVIQQHATPGMCPTGLTYANSTLWVADRKTDSLYQIDPETGKLMKSFTAPGYFITDLAWDGKTLWAVDVDLEGMNSGSIYQICPETGTTLKMIYAPTMLPEGLTWDGMFLWLSDSREGRIYQISHDDGTTIKSFKSPAADPQGLAWDGEYLWIADRKKDEIYRVDPQTGCVVMILSSPGPYPRGLAWGENALWNVDYQNDNIYEIKIFDDQLFSRKNERDAEIVYSHEIVNYGPGVLKDVAIFFAIPENLDNQDILDIRYSVAPTRFDKDQWKQRFAVFHADTLKTGESLSPEMTIHAKVYDIMYHIFPEKVGSLKEIPGEIRSDYLKDDLKYWIHDPVIQDAVKKAVGQTKNPYWIARSIYSYIQEAMHYELAGGWNVAPTVLKRGSGSCSEYTFVYIAMCRAAGLPARYAGSVVVRGDDASLDYVFHRWVEVYLPRYGWVPVDPSGGDKDWPRDQAMCFGHLENRFLITTIGGGGSAFLGWDYNSSERWKADGPVKLKIEKLGEWNPIVQK